MPNASNTGPTAAGVCSRSYGPGHAAALYGTGKGGTGLFGLLNEALWDAAIEYDPTAYPYFYKADLPHTAANAFKAFTPNTLAAAQNVQQLYFTGNPGQQAFLDQFILAKVSL